MDNLDRAIIDELYRDGRITNVELGRRVGLTPGPCLRRVQRLEDSGVIRRYRAVVDPLLVGRGFTVLIDVELTQQDAETVDRFETALATAPEVVELRRLFGKPDFFVRVEVADLASYERFLSTRLTAIPGVGQVHSRFTIKAVKLPD